MKSKVPLSPSDKQDAGLDLTALRQLVTSLEERVDLLRTTSELTADLGYSILTDADGIVKLEWTAGSVAQLLGLTPEELAAQGGFESLVHPDHSMIA